MTILDPPIQRCLTRVCLLRPAGHMAAAYNQRGPHISKHGPGQTKALGEHGSGSPCIQIITASPSTVKRDPPKGDEEQTKRQSHPESIASTPQQLSTGVSLVLCFAFSRGVSSQIEDAVGGRRPEMPRPAQPGHMRPYAQRPLQVAPSLAFTDFASAAHPSSATGREQSLLRTELLGARGVCHDAPRRSSCR